jgi:hypothetical protein
MPPFAPGGSLETSGKEFTMKIKISSLIGLLVFLAFGLVLAGCPTEDNSPPAAVAKRLVKGKIGSSSSARLSIRGASGRISRSIELPESVANEPFYLDTDPAADAPDGMIALKGKVLSMNDDGEDIVIILTGLLDTASGKFVAAGVDSQDLGIGIQIEGFFKNDTIKDVKITVKMKDMDEQSASFEEWQETDVSYTPVDSKITETETADQEEGLPAAWTGKYAHWADADGWETIINDYLADQEFSATGTGGITVGKAVGDIFAEDGNVFILVAPMAWSYVINFEAMDSKLSSRLEARGFQNVPNVMSKLHQAMYVYQQMFYCSFLEISRGDASNKEMVVNPANESQIIEGTEDPTACYALAFTIVPDLKTGEELGKFFTRYKIFVPEEIRVEGMENNRQQLILSPAYDLTYDWPAIENLPGSTSHSICRTAAEAREGKQFQGASVFPWIFSRE